MRLIDADALLAKQEFVADGVYVDVWNVELAPTIEAEPVKHGRCPVCGAKMDLEERMMKLIDANVLLKLIKENEPNLYSIVGAIVLSCPTVEAYTKEEIENALEQLVKK